MNTAKLTRLIEFALKMLECNQKELAIKLEVSQSQITMWKKGESISLASMKKICDLLAISEVAAENLDIVEAVHGIKNYEAWISYIISVIHRNVNATESPVDIMCADSISEHPSHVAANALEAFVKCGVKFPNVLPDVIVQLSEVDLESIDYDLLETLEDQEESNTHYQLISSFTHALTAYLSVFIQLENESDCEDIDQFNQVEWSIINHAAYRAIQLAEHTSLSQEILKVANYEAGNSGIKLRENIDTLKKVLFKKSSPITVDLGMILTESPQDIIEHLNHVAEEKAFGFGEPPLHPDIYMNELLVNSRKQTAMLTEIYQALGLHNEGGDISSIAMAEKIRNTLKTQD